MNSIIWKGVSSTTINGLLISELPPISKPAMRVKETTIDGRDGSIIEELGYSSYDKNVVIGLHGNFDINKVIKYFTGEGEVVFSNEPDKVYTAKIVGQIDYNRLLRYRQATIPFRVQPFKHKLNEAYKPAPTATTKGTSIVLNDSANATIKNIVVGDGSKTEGQVEITTMGKNLLPYPYANTTKSQNGITFIDNGDGSVTIDGTATADAFLNLQENVEYGGSMNAIASQNASNDTYTISKRLFYNQANKKLSIVVAKGMTVSNETIYPMIEIGTTSSAYVPYQKSVATYDYATNTLDSSLKSFEPMTTITNSDGAAMSVEYFKSFEVFNEGLETSKPIMVLKGEGTVVVSVNGYEIFQYTFPEGENEVVIDCEKEDAYLGDVLKNRNMNGEFPVLLSGTNIIEWSGFVSSIEILPRSRWL